MTSSDQMCTSKYATIAETSVGGDVRLCGNTQQHRESHAYISRSNEVRIRLTGQTARFMLRFDSKCHDNRLFAIDTRANHTVLWFHLLSYSLANCLPSFAYTLLLETRFLQVNLALVVLCLIRTWRTRNNSNQLWFIPEHELILATFDSWFIVQLFCGFIFVTNSLRKSSEQFFSATSIKCWYIIKVGSKVSVHDTLSGITFWRIVPSLISRFHQSYLLKCLIHNTYRTADVGLDVYASSDTMALTQLSWVTVH